MLIDAKTKVTNEQVISGLTSDDTNLQKEARYGVQDYLRLRAREDGIFRNILPPKTVTDADLDRQVDTAQPVIVKDMEPNSTPAISLPFGGVPPNMYMDAPRYRIMFDRIMSARYTADVNNLRTYSVDLRQIFNDLMLKDILAEEDRKFIAVADASVGTLDTASGTRYTEVAAKGYISLGALSQTSLALWAAGLPSTNRNLRPALSLCNTVTATGFLALGYNAIGSLAEKYFVDGFGEKTVNGVRWVFTIKKDLVPNNVAYQFTAPEFLGDNLTLDDVTVYTKKDAYFFEMFAYETVGGTLKNLGAFCKGIFSGSAGTWA